MEIEEKAKIIAFAKLLGVDGSDMEILDKFEKYYQSAMKSQTPQTIKGNPVTVFKRPV